MSEKNPVVNILIIDDDPVVRNYLRSVLKDKLNVFAVEAPSTGFRIIENENIDILICDFKLPEMDGLQVLEKIKNEHPDIAVIMISSVGDMDVVINALRQGAIDFIRKPLALNEIWLAIERTRKYTELNSNLRNAKKQNRYLAQTLNHEFGSIIGRSAGIENIRKQMQMVARTPDTSVLIIGESGTGKELVAHGIHNHSSRKEELFSAVNMSAVPESLFESEFFGHKKGSFTGAIADKSGWFETTDGGTLFFDEIGEMSMSLQVKLLRVLEDRRFIKVGSQQEKRFDVRIIAATNKPLYELTSGKTLRTDLFHRLGTFIIEIPPLRERKEDIPVLADHFLEMISKKTGRIITGIHKDAYALLNEYSFPGNVRELRNIIERSVILCDKNVIMPSHITIHGLASVPDDASSSSVDLFDLGELEKQTILRALKKVNYNKAEAARLLNLEWNALYRRIQKFGIILPS
jgi:DNA-binding NtrC family response regulator